MVLVYILLGVLAAAAFFYAGRIYGHLQTQALYMGYGIPSAKDLAEYEAASERVNAPGSDLLD